MGRVLFLVFLLVLLPPVAEAQDAERDSVELEHAHYLRDVGAGLTLGGIGATALGVGLMFGITGFENWSGLVVGGLFEGIGGVLSLVGIPLWIAGGVQSDVLSHPADAWEAVGWSYELAGMVTTLTSIAICLVGGALTIAALMGRPHSRTVEEDTRYDQMIEAGAFMMPIGYFVATFIGAPMWSEGARF